MDPITSNQLTSEEIKRCELDPNSVKLIINPATIMKLKEEVQDILLSKRQDKPAAIAGLKFYPEIADPKYKTGWNNKSQL